MKKKWEEILGIQIYSGDDLMDGPFPKEYILDRLKQAVQDGYVCLNPPRLDELIKILTELHGDSPGAIAHALWFRLREGAKE